MSKGLEPQLLGRCGVTENVELDSPQGRRLLVLDYVGEALPRVSDPGRELCGREEASPMHSSAQSDL